MEKHQINDRSTWPTLKEAVSSFAKGGAAAVPDATFTVIADRVRAAVEGSDHELLKRTSSALEQFFRALFAEAPPKARDAARRVGDADTSAAYLLGQAAFAHLMAARTFDLRVDDHFLRVLQEKRYRPYLRALLAGPRDGTSLARAAGEAKETVSRKLAVLRGRGVIFSRRDGTTVVNSLSPPAAAFLQHLGVVPADGVEPQTAAVSAEIARARDGLPEHLRQVPSFSLPANADAFGKVA